MPAKKLFLQKPHSLREQEKNRLNPALINSDALTELLPEIPYLWALNKDCELMIGIEKPWLYPQAFGFTENNALWLQIKGFFIDVISTKGFGHPTLVPIFDQQGNVITGTNTHCAYLGGEIYFHKNQWVVNNSSGRFGIKAGLWSVDKYTIYHSLQFVANKLQKLTEVPVIINMILGQPSYINLYLKHWSKGKDNFQSAVYLIKDYVQANFLRSCCKLSLFRSSAKSRNLVKLLLHKIKINEITTIEEMMAFFCEGSRYSSLDKSLSQRLRFIVGQCSIETSFMVPDIFSFPASNND